MQTIIQLSSDSRGMILMLLFFLLLVQLFEFLLAVFLHIYGRHVMEEGLFAVTLLGFVLVCSGHLSTVSGARFWRYEEQIGDIPAILLFIFVVLALIGTIYSCVQLLRFYRERTGITAFSIKESIDNLPSGLAFARESGFVLLANRQMEQLSYVTTGLDLQNAEEFWKILLNGDLQAGCSRIQSGEVPAIRLPDGNICSFSRQMIQAEGRPVIQLTAVDTTQQFALAGELEKKNEELSKVHQKLERYGKEMADFVRSREILEMKMQIHNEIGQALLATRAWLQSQEDGGEPRLFKQCEAIIALMRAEAEPKQGKTDWEIFCRCAQAAGVEIRLDGKLPGAGRACDLLIAAAAEALTNAVRHAKADSLYVYICREGSMLQVRFCNNGAPPKQKIIEGGGLSALRLQVEEAGGSMQILSAPQFVLILLIPEEEEESRWYEY